MTPSNAKAHCMYFGQCSHHLQFILISSGDFCCCCSLSRKGFAVCIHSERSIFTIVNVVFATPIPKAIFKIHRDNEKKNGNSMYMCICECFVSRRSIFILFYFKRMLMFDVFFMHFLHFLGNSKSVLGCHCFCEWINERKKNKPREMRVRKCDKSISMKIIIKNFFSKWK